VGYYSDTYTDKDIVSFHFIDQSECYEENKELEEASSQVEEEEKRRKGQEESAQSTGINSILV
jgi:hypothetical protein